MIPDLPKAFGIAGMTCVILLEVVYSYYYGTT